jgi:hypothetical protein
MGRYAYLIGSNEFQHDSGLTNLVGPQNDVEELSKLLADSERGMFEVRKYVNANSWEIAKELFSTFSSKSSDDVLLVYFSGHGLLDEDGDLYLSAANTDKANVAATGLRASDVLRRMQLSGARQRALVLDCCYSGAIGLRLNKGDVGTASQVQLKNISDGSGTNILTSSTDTQVSKDGPISIFSKYFIEGIQSGDADKDLDGLITLHDLFLYTSENVRAAGVQKPTYLDTGSTAGILISASGKTSLSEMRKRLREKLREYRDREDISDHLFSFLMRRFDKDCEYADATKSNIDRLSGSFLNGELSFGVFQERLVAERSLWNEKIDTRQRPSPGVEKSEERPGRPDWQEPAAATPHRISRRAIAASVAVLGVIVIAAIWQPWTTAPTVSPPAPSPQQARDEAAQQARDRAAQQARDRAAQQARDQAAQQARDEAAPSALAEAQTSSVVASLLSLPVKLSAKDLARFAGFDGNRATAIAAAKATTDREELNYLNDLAAVLAGNEMPITQQDIVGDWRCRTLKLGGGLGSLTIYAFFRCRISAQGDALIFQKISGSQRTRGALYRVSNTRYVYVGAGTVNEDQPFPYGTKPDADEVAYLIRVGANRLRLEFPKPSYESDFDIMDLRK